MTSTDKSLLLLVDDEEGMRIGLSRWLAHDYDVVSAQDGLEGLAILERLDRVPDVLVVDVWMPGLDGIEMVRRVRANPMWRRIPVIYLTGQTAVRTMIEGIASGARSYLTKPVDLNLLDRKLRSAIRARQSEGAASATPHK